MNLEKLCSEIRPGCVGRSGIVWKFGLIPAAPTLEKRQKEYDNRMAMNHGKMKKKAALSPGRPRHPGAFFPVVRSCVLQLEEDGVPGKAQRRLFGRLAEEPQSFKDHPVLGDLAAMLCGESARRASVNNAAAPGASASARAPAPWCSWGRGLDPKAVEQMADGCSLPVAVRGALMPDAHVGYGLPIGGVLAVDNAVIPYGVGMDIACRMKMSVFSVSAQLVQSHADELARAIEEETCFGVGGRFKERKDHPVMREDWGFPRDAAHAGHGLGAAWHQRFGKPFCRVGSS